jgi:hypothetical protein
MCADNGGNSYPEQETVIKSLQGNEASFDFINNQSDTACEVKKV